MGEVLAGYKEVNGMIDEVRGEAGIRQLHARYADAVFRKDFAAFGDGLFVYFPVLVLLGFA